MSFALHRRPHLVCSVEEANRYLYKYLSHPEALIPLSVSEGTFDYLPTYLTLP